MKIQRIKTKRWALLSSGKNGLARWGIAALLLIFAMPVSAPGQEQEQKQQVPLPGDEGEDLIGRIKEGMEKIDESLLGAR
ncbi:MAG: hypothetical protein KJ645_02875 [Planctomycetes bacterium]|nr:hypothetical protein [Planctomycetota bacterium]